MKEKIRKLEQVYEVVNQLEALILVDGYYKDQLANIVGTTKNKIENFMLNPKSADPYEDWCLEVNWLYDLHHKELNQGVTNYGYYDF